jgi:hypothetical protein
MRRHASGRQPRPFVGDRRVFGGGGGRLLTTGRSASSRNGRGSRGRTRRTLRVELAGALDGALLGPSGEL